MRSPCGSATLWQCGVTKRRCAASPSQCALGAKSIVAVYTIARPTRWSRGRRAQTGVAHSNNVFGRDIVSRRSPQRKACGPPSSEERSAPVREGFVGCATSQLGSRLSCGAIVGIAASGPLVGRVAELAVLDEADGRSGSVQVVALSGEGGIGKSRLASEGLRSARARGFRTLEGAAGQLQKISRLRL